jgi:hypothetical protein
MTRKLHLTIDSSELGIEMPGNVTLPLENFNCESYNRVALNHIYLHHESDVRLLFRFNSSVRPIYIRCSLLNKDDNLLNGQKSDVIGILYPETRSKLESLSAQLPSNAYKLVKSDTKIGMSLTSADGTPVDERSKFEVIYELEFSWS